jgi:hypothetical protein
MALDLALPMYPWTYRSGGIGGQAVAASGVQESYVIRTDRLVSCRVRLYEHEINDFLAEVEAIRASGASFTFSFNQDDALTDTSVYWHSPPVPDEVTVERDESYPGLFVASFELRTATAGAPFTAAFAETP